MPIHRWSNVNPVVLRSSGSDVAEHRCGFRRRSDRPLASAMTGMIDSWRERDVLNIQWETGREVARSGYFAASGNESGELTDPFSNT